MFDWEPEIDVEEKYWLGANDNTGDACVEVGFLSDILPDAFFK